MINDNNEKKAKINMSNTKSQSIFERFHSFFSDLGG